MALLEELAKESAERERKKRQASQGQSSTSKVGIVALYSLCQNGDRTPLTAALRVCKENGWIHPVTYVDWHIPGDHEPSMYNHMVSDVSEGRIQILVTHLCSPEFVGFCQSFGCRVIPVEI